MRIRQRMSWFSVICHRPRRALKPRRLRRLRIEALEARRLMAASGLEQEFVYLLNRARHDPVAYAQEVNLGVDLSSVIPQPPLAVNEQLFASAGFHAEEMAEFDYFGHQSDVTGDWPNKMARDAGYPLPSGWADDANFIESLTAGQANAAAALRALIHDGGGATGGHRSHLLGIGDFWGANREAGIGHAFDMAATYRNYWAIHLARRGPGTQYLTGVVFNDANNNQRYDAGEGLGGVTVSAGDLTTTTNAGGGWSIPTPDGEYLVKASGGPFQGASMVPIVMASDNVEIDFRSGRPGGQINFIPWVNTAPVLDNTGDPTLQPVLRGDPDPPGTVVASFLGDAVSDSDPAAQQGIAVVGSGGAAAGAWQYSIDGGSTWNSLNASISAARLLRDTDLVRFLSDAGAVGTATLTYHAWDRTLGEPGDTASLNATGGVTPFSAVAETAPLTVLAANTAPTLFPTGDRTLPAIPEDTTLSEGALVREILGMTATDPDPGTKLGMALMAADGANGKWEYSSDGGVVWNHVGAVSSTAALLLRDIDRLRFIPAPDFNGAPLIAYHAWDQMSGAAGQKVDLSSGVVDSVSAAGDTAAISITPVNDAPVLDPAGQPRMAPIPVNPPSNPPQRISDILGSLVSDVDAAALEGIAITGVTGDGQWWFVNDGQWQGGSTTPHFAWLLKATDQIVFVPANNWSGTASFTFRAWDQTTGPEVDGIWANVSDPSRYGGTKAYSETSLTATLFVGPPGEAPTVQSIARADANPTSQTSLKFNVAFSEDVVNVDPSDFRVVTTGSVAGQVTEVSGSGASYLVTVSNVSGEGTLGLAFDDMRDIKDSIGNPLDLASFAGSDVYDVQTLQLTLALDRTSSSEAALIPAANATVTRVGGNLALPLAVTVASSDPGEASVVSSVVIPAGEISAALLVQAVDDDLLDGPQTVEISVAAPGYQGDSRSLVIVDHETLTVILDTDTVAENAGPAAVHATVQRSNSDNGQALLVTLTSSDPGEAAVPSTVLIPAGASSASFTLDPAPDGVRDGTQHVTIAASAVGYFSESAPLDVTDSDGLTAVDDSAQTDEDQPISIDVLANDHVAGAAIFPSSVTITALSASGEVSVDPATGEITYAPHENFSGADSFEYSVSDDGGLTDIGHVVITVIQVNDAPKDILLDAATVAENEPGVAIGALTVSDADSGDVHTWSISDSRFEVQGGVLKLKAGVALNFEAEAAVTLQITASDSGAPPAEITRQFVLTVIDREEIIPPWQNPALRWDVDGNGKVRVADLLMLVLALRVDGSPHDLPADEGREAPYLDVDGDGSASLEDLLDLVQRLREEVNAG
jgi:hypothetical protein